MVLVKLCKKSVHLNKPIYASFSILDLSIYNETIELMMTDTDSLVYCINADDFYKHMKCENTVMSEYSKHNTMYDETNKK